MDRIAGLLAELGELMRQEDLGKEFQHPLRQLQMRVRFAQEQSGEGVAETGVIPTKAPELWLERSRHEEDPVSFVRRVWGSYLGRGLGKHHIRVLDNSLYHSLRRHIRLHGTPADFDLPSKKEILSREIAAAGDLSVSHTPDQRRKLSLRKALQRRKQKGAE